MSKSTIIVVLFLILAVSFSLAEEIETWKECQSRNSNRVVDSSDGLYSCDKWCISTYKHKGVVDGICEWYGLYSKYFCQCLTYIKY